MKLVIIFGPQAVGKMTVGRELAKLTGLKLFHNHMTIELVSPFFSYSSVTGKRLVNLFRQEIFQAMVSSDQPGLIFTYVWAFDEKEDWDYIEKIYQLFKSNNAEVFFIELEADFAERLKRNRHPDRLKAKPTKQDLNESENELKETSKHHRLNSLPGEIKYKNYFRINNTNLSPKVVAKIIEDNLLS